MPIPNMYARCTLDCLVELAYAVSNDFVSRVHLYQGNDIPDEIIDLRMSYGTARSLPNTQQRQFMYLPIFGRSDGLLLNGSSSAFHTNRKKLIEAATAISERVYDTGLPMLRESLRSALIPLNTHLEGVKGQSLNMSNTQSEAIFNTATSILSSAGIARVFGVQQVAKGWPLSSNDPNGAKLTEAIGLTLRLPSEYALSHDKFVTLQRVASYGTTALELVLAPDPGNDKYLDRLATAVYAWGISLRDFQS